ncbi:hypothetical protein TcasGA2_TC014555 [Tribolium castaneum]|uniref:Uncharacterized protein n=1 Tax=Tribolium castaneum TaxID=7070 RepID=D6WMG2_TRICA|nr:hypothetical protein TcasGA2_TC014555 [Tribolium castaneum]
MNYSGRCPKTILGAPIAPFSDRRFNKMIAGEAAHKLGCLQNDEQIIKNIKKGSTMENKEIKMINHKTFACANPCFDSKGIRNDETNDPTQERNRPLPLYAQ